MRHLPMILVTIFGGLLLIVLGFILFPFIKMGSKLARNALMRTYKKVLIELCIWSPDPASMRKLIEEKYNTKLED